jgi:predicted tellurium resistance membrane protein TerC
MEWLFEPQAWIALATLTGIEIVLGIDNIIFISILVSRLPSNQQNKARILGLLLAMFTRIILLLSLTWVMSLTKPLFTILANEISGRDLILISGGLFLLGKSTHEIHNSFEGNEEKQTSNKGSSKMLFILIQIAIIDIIFSLDSVITAVGLADHVEVMITAIVISVGIMMFSAKAIGEFVDTNPTIKMLALSFLILIGVTLMGDGLSMHMPKGYIYFAMAFSIIVEMLNIKIQLKIFLFLLLYLAFLNYCRNAKYKSKNKKILSCIFVSCIFQIQPHKLS